MSDKMAQLQADVHDFMAENPDWRLGQTWFNVLHMQRPDLANEIRGNTTLDPFYVDARMSVFLDWLAGRL